MKYKILLLLAALTMVGCNQSSNRELEVQQESLMKEANRQVGMPAIKNFSERKFMKLILELRDDPKLICYAYIIPEVTGKPVFLGKCIGYGLPYATQYTNPESYYANGASLPQADPNGLFMPSSAEATWLLLINPNTNEPQPVYVEQKLLISPFELQL